jgi:hypothetical protein
MQSQQLDYDSEFRQYQELKSTVWQNPDSKIHDICTRADSIRISILRAERLYMVVSLLEKNVNLPDGIVKFRKRKSDIFEQASCGNCP